MPLCLCLRHGRGHRGVPGAGAGRSRAGAAGDVLVAAQLVGEFRDPLGIADEFIDMSDPDAVSRALRPGGTRLVWIETPANPLWTTTDIAATCALAHAAGAAVAVDSTTATPVLTQPLALGADIVMHSATKYLNGHSDVIAGAGHARGFGIVAADQGHPGAVGRHPWPLRSVAAHARHAHLFLRVRRLRRRAGHRRAFRAASDGEAVLYPGLPSRRATRWRHGRCKAASAACCPFACGARTRIGGEDAAIATAARVELWKRATSLGGVESLVEHRASIEGAGTPAPPDLLRLSVGLEDPDDLIADLEQALARAHR